MVFKCSAPGCRQGYNNSNKDSDVSFHRFPQKDSIILARWLEAIPRDTHILSLYYYTFVDLLDYRDHVDELLITLDAYGIVMGITRSFDLTSFMILLSHVEDWKAVLRLYNAAHEMIHVHSDVAFPRLGNIILEYDNPLKKLSEEFGPHSQTLTTALLSLAGIYPRRNLSVEKWRSAKMLSLVSNPGQLLNPSNTDTIPYKYLSLELIEKWIIFDFPCAALIVQVVNKKKRGKSRKIIFDKELPEFESYRKTREDLTTIDKLDMALTELC
ncbi:Uncharacterized protein FKW44_005053 [Caligus rogercresseyi]|uniref:THAP-type domain-containing protein n=1 Tax=Caligus rogercresseyi TaxID=217165 RepID=A0A7T8KBE4_CALRO|nr:Uncharacterized protein FKW44_005053 [Caligus rogercresseyi]